MTEKFEDIKMKYVILETWKNKLGYPLNYKDIEELENIIDYYKQESEQLNERIDKAIEEIELNISNLNESIEKEEKTDRISALAFVGIKNIFCGIKNILKGESNE